MKIVFALLGVIVATGAFADDATVETETVATEEVVTEAVVTPTVAERMSCADMTDKIAELSAVENPDDATVAELDALKNNHRRTCSRSAGARKTSGRGADVAGGPVVEAETIAVAEVVDEAPEVIEISAQQVKANLESGLCADGSKPNKFGCCGDEIFKDMGNTVFACCPKQGGDCFPPIK